MYKQITDKQLLNVVKRVIDYEKDDSTYLYRKYLGLSYDKSINSRNKARVELINESVSILTYHLLKVKKVLLFPEQIEMYVEFIHDSFPTIVE